MSDAAGSPEWDDRRAEQRPVAAGTLLREARRRAQLTQVELAERAGLTQSVISTYENGRREPSLVALQRLIRAAGFVWRIELEPAPEPRSLRQRVDEHRDELVAAFTGLGGSGVRLVGSAARGDRDPRAGVEFLVDLAPGSGLFALMRMQDAAERILATRVEVVARDAVPEPARSALLRDAVPL